MNNYQNLTQEEIAEIRENSILRQKLAQDSHLWFFLLYMSEYMEYDFAPFHKEMFKFTEDETITLANVTAFRGSAKSTIFTQSFPIWAMTGNLNKKFILIVSQTQAQARLHLSNIKRELENNILMKSDIGPFQEISDEWSSSTIVVPKYNTRISAISTDQSMRGVRHHQHRPDLIILDDIEDLASVKTKEQRDKTYDWVMGDVIPAGSEKTKIVIVGNLLHDDSVQMRLAEHIENKEIDGVFREYPLLDEASKPTWESRFPDQLAIEKLKKRTADEISWQREYLLKIIADAEQVVHRDWLHFYENNELPPVSKDDFYYVGTGVDLAISNTSSSDSTAMVSAYVFGHSDKIKIYILPNPINKKITFPQTVETIQSLEGSLAPGRTHRIFIEKVGYQESLIQQLHHLGCKVEGISVASDKRTRLSLTTNLIKNGNVLFPKTGCEDLLNQMLGFGKEKHDDLVDAFSMLVNEIAKRNESPPQIWII